MTTDYGKSCLMCSGEYCDVHGSRYNCCCDTAERHGNQPCGFAVQEPPPNTDRQNLTDAVMIIRRLCKRLPKDDSLRIQAADWIQRKGLGGSILREEP